MGLIQKISTLFHLDDGLVMDQYGIDAHEDIYLIKEDADNDVRIATKSNGGYVGNIEYVIKDHFGFDYRLHDMIECKFPNDGYVTQYEFKNKGLSEQENIHSVD